MDKIQNTLAQWGKGSSFKEKYNEMKGEMLQQREIRHFLNENSSRITREILEKNINTLYEFSSQSKHCENCPSLGECINVMKGFDPRLTLVGDHIELMYDRCPRKKVFDERTSREKLVQSFHVPKEILGARMDEIDLTENERLIAVRKAKNFTETYKKDETEKGLFFYGRFGVGKTYLLGAIANELAEKNVSSFIVHVPELIRELKNSIADSTLEEKIKAVRTAEVLMLDDIGAETISSWVRDEIFGTILQYRMLEKLPTFFTSNFELTQLEHHFTFNAKGDQEDVKAGRLIDRIRSIATPVSMGGQNRRG